MLRWLFILWMAFAGAAFAQEPPNYNRFDAFASSVETSIQNNRLPAETFDSLRDALVDWRESFLAARDDNAVQVEALEAQIAALGPVPADGATEPTAVSDRRAALNEEYETALAPRLEADEAFARADALIRQIDATLRARQADALLELGRTPLDPTLWPATLTALFGVGTEISDEAVANLTSDRSAIWQRLFIAVVLVALALMLIFRGPRVIEARLADIETQSGDQGRVVFGYLLSFGNVLVAMIGVSMLNVALISSGLLGETGRAVAIGVNIAILAYAISRWLGGRVFPVRASIPTPINLTDPDRAKGRRAFSGLGAATGLAMLVAYAQNTIRMDADILGVVLLPIFLLAAFFLFRVGGLITKGGQAAENAEPAFSDRVERLLGRALQLAALVGALSALVGLQNLAAGILVPSAQSLAVAAFLASLHFAMQSGYGLARGLDADETRQALLPVLMSFVLTLVSTLIFALIWGARDSDLGEIWTRFKTGVPLGETSISPLDFLTFAAVFAIGYGITRLLQGTLRSSVLPRTNMDTGGRNAIVSGLGYLGVTIAAIVGITAAGIDLSSFAIIIGALGVGIGFGLQNIVNNFVSGIILLIERPITEGDWVEVNGQMGIVKAISVRSTRIQTFDRTDVIVPNGDLISGTVTNWTRGNSVGRVIVPVGVAYGTDTRKVETILREIAEANPIVSMTPPPAVIFKGFGADSMDFEIRAILSDINFGLTVTSDMNHEIARRFAEEGIEIPFAQRDVWLRNPETLAQPPVAEN